MRSSFELFMWVDEKLGPIISRMVSLKIIPEARENILRILRLRFFL